MSLENELKKLNISVTDLISAVQALVVTSNQITTSPPPVAEVVPTTVGAVEDLVAAESTPPALDPPAGGAITKADLGLKLSGLAGKHGAPAQDAIKKIILETAGTQALSQVKQEHLPIILAKVIKYEEYMESGDRG